MKPNEYERFLYASLYCLIIRFQENLTVCDDMLILRDDMNDHINDCVNNRGECIHAVHTLREFYSSFNLRALHVLIELIALNNDVYDKSSGGGENLLYSLYYELSNDVSSWSQLLYQRSITDRIDAELDKLNRKRRKKQVASYIENPTDFDLDKRKKVVEKVMNSVLAARGYVVQLYLTA